MLAKLALSYLASSERQSASMVMNTSLAQTGGGCGAFRNINWGPLGVDHRDLQREGCGVQPQPPHSSPHAGDYHYTLPLTSCREHACCSTIDSV